VAGAWFTPQKRAKSTLEICDMNITRGFGPLLITAEDLRRTLMANDLILVEDGAGFLVHSRPWAFLLDVLPWVLCVAPNPVVGLELVDVGVVDCLCAIVVVFRWKMWVCGSMRLWILTGCDYVWFQYIWSRGVYPFSLKKIINPHFFRMGNLHFSYIFILLLGLKGNCAEILPFVRCGLSCDTFYPTPFYLDLFVVEK
jgi:hypothetical protein